MTQATTAPRLTARQYLKLHPEKYVVVTYEFGTPIYIGPLDSRFHFTATPDKDKATVWNAMDFGHDGKMWFMQFETGYKGLVWEALA